MYTLSALVNAPDACETWQALRIRRVKLAKGRFFDDGLF